MTKIRPHDVN